MTDALYMKGENIKESKMYKSFSSWKKNLKLKKKHFKKNLEMQMLEQNGKILRYSMKNFISLIPANIHQDRIQPSWSVNRDIK